MPSSDQCAVGTDGTLLDQSKITWYNDPDDSIPIAPTADTVPPSAPPTPSALKATTLHTFFKDGSTSAGADLDMGIRRSSRISKPSKRVLDANHMDQEMPKRTRRTKVVESESESEADDENKEHDDAVATQASGGGDTDVDMGDPVMAEDAYELTKAMGDQDRKVCLL